MPSMNIICIFITDPLSWNNTNEVVSQTQGILFKYLNVLANQGKKYFHSSCF